MNPADLAEDRNHYRRIAAALKLENEAYVATIHELKQQVMETEERLASAEAEAAARADVGLAFEIAQRRQRRSGSRSPGLGGEKSHNASVEILEPEPEFEASYDTRHSRASRGENNFGRSNSSTGYQRTPTQSQVQREERTVVVTKVLPNWVFGPAQGHVSDEVYAALRGMHERVSHLEAQLKRSQAEKIKLEREYELKLQDMQRKLNKREEEIKQLRSAVPARPRSAADVRRPSTTAATLERS
jgi:hypothetical protein